MSSRFVILRHEMPATATRPSHWDVMLEHEKALLTWAVEDEPCLEVTLPAKRLADHRTAYLTYVGPVSDDRGEVHGWDEGGCEIVTLTAEVVEARLTSRRWSEVTIRLTLVDAGNQRWSVRFSAASDLESS